MSRRLELLLLPITLACALLPALGRCDTTVVEQGCEPARAPEDFAFLLSQQDEANGSACGTVAP